ncbi:MAG: DUF4388 domain-containing protein [Acidobacteria bacterium]|nr:MAG: DUF4388 domain-containing protein [Acidobacteriota bacterium]REK12090.1 MAG: DUF4388 domain-containing protein [Acidobacteriota bacterium]
MEKRYQFRGSLGEQPLAEILFKAHQYSVPGVIEALRDDVVKRLYLQSDEVIFASSSDLEESLGHFLLKSNQLSKEDFRRTMRDRRDSDQRYGNLIIDEGLLSPAALRRAIQLQTAEVLWELFSWTEGEVTFSIGTFEPPSQSRIHIPVRLAIKEGVKRAGDAKRYLARVGTKDTRLEADYEIEDLIVASLEDDEFALLRMVDPRHSLVELCRSGPFDAPTNGKLLYAFKVLQLIRPLGSRSEEPEDPRALSGGFKMRYTARLKPEA